MNRYIKYNSAPFEWSEEDLQLLEESSLKMQSMKSSLFKIRKDFMSKYNLKLNQYLTMIILKNHIKVESLYSHHSSSLCKIKNKKIASILFVNKSNVSRYLEVLKERKIISKGLYKYQNYWFVDQKLIDKCKNYWFINPDISIELDQYQCATKEDNVILLNMEFYPVCNTIESVLVLSGIWFDYYLQNKTLNERELYLKLPISDKTVKKHIKNFIDKKIISTKGQFSKEFILEHEKFIRYRDIKIMD